MARVSLRLHAAALLAMLGACGGGAEQAPPIEAKTDAAHQAITAFWTTFGNHDIDQAAEACAALVAAVEQEPENGDLLRLTGMCHQWRVAEDGRATTPMPDRVAATRVGLEHLNRATNAEPSGYNFSFLGAGLYKTGLLADDAAMRAQGRAVIEQKAIPGEKVFGLWVKGGSLAFASAADPDFSASIEPIFQAWEECLGRPLDRERPDFSGLENLTPDPNRPRRVCWNWQYTPHGQEGRLLKDGDIMAKAGKSEAARAMYLAATRTSGYRTWRYRDVVESRLKEDLTERRRAYQDPDRSKWPVIGVTNGDCVMCHGR